MKLAFGIADESVKCQHGIATRTEHAGIASIYHERGIFFDEDEHLRRQRIDLVAGKNDFAAFQIVLRSEDEDWLLATTDSTAFSPFGAIPTIRLEASIAGSAGLDCAVFPEGMMEDDDRLLKADVLLHDETVLVKKGVCQAAWVEIGIPGDFGGDRIEGSVRLYQHALFGNETLVGSVAFSVDVFDVRLPDPRDFRFNLDLWHHLANIARKHEVRLWSDEHFQVLDRYVASLARLGQKAATVVVSEVPWSGQRCYAIRNYPSNLFEYNIVRVTRDRGGTLSFDFSALDRYVELCFRHGITGTIEILGLTGIWYFPGEGFGKVAEDFEDAIRVRYRDETDGTFKFLDSGADIERYIKGIEEHFVDRGWIDRAVLAADEPADDEAYRRFVATIRRVAPRFRLRAYYYRPSFLAAAGGAVDESVASLACFTEVPEGGGTSAPKRPGAALWYTACGSFPDSCIRAPLLESRFIGWLTAYLGLDGFVRWNYTVWPEHPREMICYDYPLFPAGETCFVYPGNDGRPLLTLRYQSLRRGIMDFELIEMVRRLHPHTRAVLDRAFACVMGREAAPGGRPEPPEQRRLGVADYQRMCSHRYEDYEAAKRILLEALAPPAR